MINDNDQAVWTLTTKQIHCCNQKGRFFLFFCVFWGLINKIETKYKNCIRFLFFFRWLFLCLLMLFRFGLINHRLSIIRLCMHFIDVWCWWWWWIINQKKIDWLIICSFAILIRLWLWYMDLVSPSSNTIDVWLWLIVKHSNSGIRIWKSSCRNPWCSTPMNPWADADENSGNEFAFYSIVS